MNIRLKVIVCRKGEVSGKSSLNMKCEYYYIIP